MGTIDIPLIGILKYDYEYKRCGMANIFLACEPLAGKRMIKVTERRTALDWAGFIEEIAAQYEHAEKNISDG